MYYQIQIIKYINQYIFWSNLWGISLPIKTGIHLVNYFVHLTKSIQLTTEYVLRKLKSIENITLTYSSRYFFIYNQGYLIKRKFILLLSFAICNNIFFNYKINSLHNFFEIFYIMSLYANRILKINIEKNYIFLI